jgi:hypothetical protein
MTSDFVTPSVEQRCIISFLVKVKPEEIIRRLNAQYGEGNLSVIGAVRLEGRKEVPDTAVSWQDHGRCVLGFRRNALC